MTLASERSLLFLASFVRRAFHVDSSGLSRVCANCDVHRHSGFQIGDRASLPVHSDFGKLRNRKCSRCFVVAHGNCIHSDRCDDWLVISRGWCCFLFSALSESWTNGDYAKKNRDEDEQPVVHDLRLNRIAQRMKQKVSFQTALARPYFLGRRSILSRSV